MYGHSKWIYGHFRDIVRTMKALKSERFEFRLTEQEGAALNKLAQKQGVSSSDLVRMLIRRSAVRQKVWQ